MCSATEKTYTVEGMTCGHCELSVRTPANGSDEDLEVSR